MSVHCIVSRTIKLSEPTKKLNLAQPLAYNNAKAHSMEVVVVNDDGTDADLTGVGVTASMNRSDGQTVEPINGTTSGNVAQVILPASCYVVPGRFTFTMNLSDGDGATRTALWVEGMVEKNTSSDIVDPGTPVGNIEQAVGNANAAASAATTAATAANTAATNAANAAKYTAPTEASSTASKAHAVGDYFVYNGKLYITTSAIASGGTITPNTNCAEIPNGLSGEVGDLKSAIVAEVSSYEDTGRGLLSRGNFKNGQYNPSTQTEQSTYVYRIGSRTAMTFKTSVVLNVKSGFRFYPWMYASNGWTTAGWQTSAFNVPANTPLMVYIARVSEDTLETADIAEFLSAVTVTYAAFNTLCVGSNRQYTTIQSAINDAIDGDFIIVYPGTYTESVDATAQKYVSIIGVDRDKCILQYSGWDYDSPALAIGRGTIKNLTIHATDTGDETAHTAYALHIDTGASIGTSASPQAFYAENCRFIGDVRQPVGIGLKRYFTCEFVNCEFECTSGYPAFYAHSWEVSEGVTNLVKQKLVLKNCTFINTSTSGNPTIQLQSQEWPDTDATLLFIGNVVVNEGGGDTIGMHIYRDNGGALDGYMGSSDWTLSPLSYGNNISGMNA